MKFSPYKKIKWGNPTVKFFDREKKIIPNLVLFEKLCQWIDHVNFYIWVYVKVFACQRKKGRKIKKPRPNFNYSKIMRLLESASRSGAFYAIQ
jgi:hypothetical protein